MDPGVVPPEERLLRLIRGPKAPPRREPSGQAPPAAPEASLPRGPAWRIRWSLPPWLLVAVNVVLGGIIVVELVAVLVMLLRPLPELPPLVAGPTPRLVEPDPAALPPRAGDDATSSPLSLIASRPLFQPPSEPEARPAGPRSAQAVDLARRLSLVGVVSGKPMQAIIEDTQTKKTQFVTAGQRLVEGVLVEEIRDDRVILELNGERLELSL